MFRFENIDLLWLLLLIPIVVLTMFVSFYHQKKLYQRLGDSQLVKQQTIGKSKTKIIVKNILLLLSLTCIIIGLARPQYGKSNRKIQRAAISAVVAVDISNSMLATDVSPSRLERCKLLVDNILDNLENDRIGLIVYAGESFTLMPISNDIASAKMLVRSINTTMVSAQGTDIASALQLSLESFGDKSNQGKAIIIITDGEDHEGNALEMAQKVANSGVKLIVLGIGTPEGAPIPNNNIQSNAYQNESFMKDNRGETVITRLNADMCKQLAHAANGKFIYLDNTKSAQKQIEKELDSIEKGDMSTFMFEEANELFPYFAILALIFLALEMILLNRKRNRKTLLKHKTTLLFSLVLFSSLLYSTSTEAQTDRDYIRFGNKAYRKGNYSEAGKQYKKALNKKYNNPQALYNLGCVYMNQSDSEGQIQGDSAVIYFQKAAKAETDKIRKAKSYHNIGVVYQANKVYDKAIEAYKEALRNNPADDETRYNLIVCQKQKKQQNQNNNSQNNQQQSKNNDKDKKQNKDNQKPKDNNQNNNKQKNNSDEQEMSKENIQAIIKAAQRQEEQTLRKLQRREQNDDHRSRKKNW